MTRHPVTGHLIKSESEWKNKKGEWLEVKTEHKKNGKGEIIETIHTPVKEKENVAPDSNSVIAPQAQQKGDK